MTGPHTPGPPTPAPIRVHRGGIALTTALRISTLLPREQKALFSILRSLNTADELLPRLVGQPEGTPMRRGCWPRSWTTTVKHLVRKPLQIWVLSGAVLLVTLVAGIAIGSMSTPTRTLTPSAAPAATTSPTPPVTRRSVAGAATAPSPPPATRAVIPATTFAVGPAKAISEREWQLIAKNPHSHIGERIIVYGQVTQFDSATGTSGFRAKVGAKAKKASYGWADYDTNTILTGTSDQLAEVVQGDLFKAEVTVAGSYSYQTTMGGSLTTPSLSVTKIDVTGHV